MVTDWTTDTAVYVGSEGDFQTGASVTYTGWDQWLYILNTKDPEKGERKLLLLEGLPYVLYYNTT